MLVYKRTWIRYSAICILFFLVFVIRLIYGITGIFWSKDPQQIYLIGLKFYTTGLWPYFGPDIVYSYTQIPGALQGLLVGLPLYLWPIPEAPFIVLNLLSFTGLLLLSYYITRLLPQIPKWIVYGYIFFMPWALYFSTHIINVSYVLLPSVLFAIPFLESFPLLRTAIFPWRVGNFLMGFALAYIMQLHMSWIALIPLVMVAFFMQTMRLPHKSTRSSLLSFLSSISFKLFILLARLL